MKHAKKGAKKGVKEVRKDGATCWEAIQLHPNAENFMQRPILRECERLNHKETQVECAGARVRLGNLDRLGNLGG